MEPIKISEDIDKDRARVGDELKKRAAAMAMGALLTLAMTAPSSAVGGGHAKHHPRAGTANPNYYNSTAGSYGNDSDGGYGGLSGAIGGIGH
jgi:hypothetical protein